MEISMETIKELREQTSCGVMECKKALQEAKGNMKKAMAILQKRGLEILAKKSGRETKEGRVEAYIHLGSKIGVLVEVNCETDFVARNEDFIQFTKNLAMHIAAVAPKYIKKDNVPADVLKKQSDQETFIKENYLLDQAYVKDPAMTIQDYLNSIVAKIGENIQIGRLVRFKVGESE